MSFFLGKDPKKHRSILPTYRTLEFGELYPGISLKLLATQRTVERVFELAPGADGRKIQVQLEGCEALRLNEAGQLVVTTPYGDVVLSKPVAWQEVGGARRNVDVRYRLEKASKRYGFALGNYDPTARLWIDPILQSTYLGGSGWDVAYAVVVHPNSGEVYVAGRTASTDFPNTSGGAQSGNGGGFADAFVARLNAALTTILQSTYLGGTDYDGATALAIHPSTGDVYLAGFTFSADFPNTTGGAQPASGGGGDAFVARLNATLTQNLQSSYLGGSADDVAGDLTIHPGTGEVFVGGSTFSTNFPNTTGGAQASPAGGRELFLSRLNAALTQNTQSTYLGGSNDERCAAVAVHPASGEVYVAGETNSANFPNTSSGAQPSLNGPLDGFLSRLNVGLTATLQSTFLGGSDEDRAWSMQIHPVSGEVYVAGVTLSSDFPNTSGGAQQSYAGNGDAFIARFNALLNSNLQSTYLGGSNWDGALGLAFHPTTGAVYAAGGTDSFDFPNTTGGAQAIFAGGRDAFVALLDPSLASNTQSTFLGGWGHDFPWDLTIHPVSGEVYVAGYTYSPDFPYTANGAQPSYGGGDWDAFVSRLTSDLAGMPDVVANGGSLPPSVGPGENYNLAFTCTNTGAAPSINATCGVAVSVGVVSGVSCTPPVPVASLPAGESITCTYTFTAPGVSGGQDTPEVEVVFTFTASADNDPNAVNNITTSNPLPVVDALDDTASFPAYTTQSHNVGANDQYGPGSLPGTVTFTLLAGTTCASASISASGAATFQVPASGTCVVAYRVCAGSGCDTAQLVVTAQQQEPIPTLDEWGLMMLVVLLSTAGVVMVRRALT